MLFPLEMNTDLLVARALRTVDRERCDPKDVANDLGGILKRENLNFGTPHLYRAWEGRSKATATVSPLHILYISTIWNTAKESA